VYSQKTVLPDGEAWSEEMKKEDVEKALSQVMDPELNKDLVSLGMVKEITVDDGKVSVKLELTTPACPLKGKIQEDCERAIRGISGVKEVEISLGARTRGVKTSTEEGKDLLPGVKNVILVASGKGGVGKSTVAINLAATLAQRGAVTGLLDADIYGPSVPTMMGVSRPPEVIHVQGKDKLVPVPAHGVGLMSIGFFVDPAQAVVWRGPMLHRALEQFLSDVQWGEMDYLVVDVPPGTGDIHISLSTFVQATGAILVTTPQNVALADVIRGRSMFANVKIPILGLVENMSYFICDGCGKEHTIFSRGGGAKAAEKLEFPFLGEIPLITGIRASCDEGVPIVVREPDGPAAKAYGKIVDALVGEIAKRAMLPGNARLKLVD
jgi:ATP-binding protein involved in chromosome partitioning